MDDAAIQSTDWHAVLRATGKATNAAREAEAKLRLIEAWHDIDPSPFLANMTAANDDLSDAATWPLFRLRPAPHLILPRLAQMLDHETTRVRIRALQLMAIYGSFCQPYLDKVVALAQSDNPLCRDAALRMLMHIGPLSEEDLRLFAPYCVPDPDDAFQQRGIPLISQAVDAMGPRAAALLPDLETHGWQYELTFVTECLTYPIVDFAQNVISADNQTRDEAYRTRLDRLFRIAKFFGDAGPPPDAVYEALFAQLGDVSTMIAESAATALSLLGPHGLGHKGAYVGAMKAARDAYEGRDRLAYTNPHYGRHVAGHLKMGLHHIGAMTL